MANTNLWIAKVIQRLLISSISLLEVIHHEVAVSCGELVSAPRVDEY